MWSGNAVGVRPGAVKFFRHQMAEEVFHHSGAHVLSQHEQHRVVWVLFFSHFLKSRKGKSLIYLLTSEDTEVQKMDHSPAQTSHEYRHCFFILIFIST